MSIFKKKNKVNENESKPEPTIHTIKRIKVSEKTIFEPKWDKEGLLIPMMYDHRLYKVLISRRVCENMVNDILKNQKEEKENE